MDITYASDNSFAWIMGVSMLSLMKNNRNISNIHFHILDGGIESENRNKISLMTTAYGCDCTFYPVKSVANNLINNLDFSRGSSSMFSRLFVEQILPKTINKILYLDCDTIILGTLQAFWDTEFDDKIVVAINDCVSDAHREWSLLTKNDVYINSGVLLIDLGQWRRCNMNSKIFDAIKIIPYNYPYADQGILNIALASKIKIAHPKYNCLPYLWEFSYRQLMRLRKPSFFYSEQETREAINAPVIVHFATFFCSQRPWIASDVTDGFCGIWRRYFALSPWAEQPLWHDTKKFHSKIFLAIYRLLPKTVAIFIAGFIHSTIRPFIGKLRLLFV